jgi:hypothetical protein
MRVNKAIELLEQRQPVYFEFVDGLSGGYEAGRALAQTWADYITYDMEHSAFDIPALLHFMRGLAEHGPTKSGHRTPAVIVTVPIDQPPPLLEAHGCLCGRGARALCQNVSRRRQTQRRFLGPLGARRERHVDEAVQ